MVVEPQMPKGVEHHSTTKGHLPQGGVVEPQMPKGVEHIRAGRQSGKTTGVVEPQMPKGVEHSPNRATSASAVIVVEPQMPKGVEHLRNYENPQALLQEKDGRGSRMWTSMKSEESGMTPNFSLISHLRLLPGL